MINENAGKEDLLKEIDETVSRFTILASSIDDNKFNLIPYENSWTAGQLLRHVTKSTERMVKAMQAEAKPADRNPTERAGELKNIFLDFSKKLQSPDFIVPEPGPYEEQNSIREFKNSFGQLKENAKLAKAEDMVAGLPFGPVTKIEILHFVLYHTQRHLNQLKRISDALKEKK